MSMQWLLARAPGFQALPEQDRTTIVNFTFLWSLFDAPCYAQVEQKCLIKSCVLHVGDMSQMVDSRNTSPTCICARQISPSSSNLFSTGATTTRAISCLL